MRKPGFRRFALLLRILSILLAGLYGVYFLIIWGMAFTGDTTLVFDLFDIESNAALSAGQILCGVISTGAAIGAIILIAFSLNRILKHISKKGYFETGLAESFRYLGWSLILFWIGLYLMDNVMPWTITKNLSPELVITPEWIPFDDGLVALFVGFALLLASDAMMEGREIQKENKQFI